MPHLFFSAHKKSSNQDKFALELKAAIKLIKINHSIVATRVLEIINSGKVTVNSFYDMSKKHYRQMRVEMLEEKSITLPEEYPPTEQAVKMIEEKLAGVIYEDKHIYLKSQYPAEQIASTLVHEICHVLNSDIYSEEEKKDKSQLFKYKDEVRSFTAEKIFERNGHCLRRSDMRKIHKIVTDLYPEFIEHDIDTQKLGYIYSCYDGPQLTP